VLQQDDRIFVFPKRLDGEDINRIPYVIDPKDLLTTIKQAHYSVVSELTQNQLDEYSNKVGVVEGIMGLGFSNDRAVI